MSTTSAVGPTALRADRFQTPHKNQKNLILLVIAGNVSEFFDMFLIGFA